MHCYWLRFTRVSTTVGQRYEDRYIEGRGNRGYGEVMIWAAFSLTSYTNVAIIDHRFSANDYIALLTQHLLPMYHQLLPQGGLYMHDNAPIHAAHVTNAFLQENNIQLLLCLSPDLNPIENIWALCKRDLSTHVVANRQQLIAAVQAVWNTRMADQEFRRTMINSMVGRVQKLHIARGSYTRY